MERRESSASMDQGRDDDYAFELRLSRCFVNEVKVLDDFVATVVQTRGEADTALFKKAQSIIEKYQEQGQLLEPHLESIISPLMATLQSRVAEFENVAEVDIAVVKKLCSIIHTLMTVCKYKTVVKFFPHQASDLETTVALLERCHQEVSIGTILREESTFEWETKSTLLLWLSILVLIPFDMTSIDTALADSAVAANKRSSQFIPPLVHRLITICKEYLAKPGQVREMAGVLLSRLLTRPDMIVALKSFVAWTHDALRTPENEKHHAFLIPGVVGALAAIFKVGGRDILLEVTSGVWEDGTALMLSPFAHRNPLLRRLLMKLIQRIGLSHLPQKAASWHYMQNSHSLAQNLAGVSVSKSSIICGSGDLKTETKYSISDCQVLKPANAYTPEDVVPEVIEEVIEQLLGGLKDQDTVVRWSAAKGLGRVTGRLSLSLVDDVVASVLELFTPTEGDGAWHGGCLALAELARRGLLLPVRLPTVVPFIVKALHYDVRRGPHSVGSHVRDAAAYVCWAFSRAYSSTLMKDHLQLLAPDLLTIACYDREVNCRRAAAAAFQECVGRQGDFEHGIDIVTAADYFSLGSRTNAYCSVAVVIAKFEKYTMPLIQELLTSKVGHWDKNLRELAVEALALLVKYDNAHFEGSILTSLLPSTLCGDLCLRHGAILAVAEIIRALHCNNFPLTPEKTASVAGIVPAIEKARLYRGKGSEIMRAAVSRLIECTALVQVPLTSKQQKILHDSIDENLKHPNPHIQSCAVAALSAFVRGYLFPANEITVSRTSAKYLQILKTDTNPAARRGCALAFGALPVELVTPLWTDIIDSLCRASVVKENTSEQDVETRVNAVHGLISVCETLCTKKVDDVSATPEYLIQVVKNQVMQTFFKALDDYAIDNRGDVGSWVREAAMVGIERCTYLLCQFTLAKDFQVGSSDINEHTATVGAPVDSVTLEKQVLLDENIAVKVIGGLVKQAVEKIDRVREVAWSTLQRLLHNSRFPVPNIPHKAELMQIVPDISDMNWAVPGETFPRLMQMLKFPEYRTFLLSGLVISVGGLADTLGKLSSNALIQFLIGMNNTEMESGGQKYGNIEPTIVHSKDWLGVELLHILVSYSGNDLVVVPALKTFDILFSRGVFSSTQALGELTSIQVLKAVKQELQGCKDVAKLLTVISILTHFAISCEGTQTEAIQQLIQLLGHRYPKVRNFCAEQLYLMTIQIGEQLLGSESTDMALELISDTCWGGQLEGILAKRDEVFSVFHLHKATALKISSEAKDKQQRVRSCEQNDENESYSALVDAAGY